MELLHELLQTNGHTASAEKTRCRGGLNIVPKREQLNVLGWDVSVLVRRAAGPGAKPPVLMIHGLVAAAESFRKLIDHLPADRDYFAIDMPGAGRSERPTSGDVSFQGMAHAVAEAARLLGVESPVLVGTLARRSRCAAGGGERRRPTERARADLVRASFFAP